MNFSQITGHSHTKNRLRHSVSEGRIAHAQLFSGDCRTFALPLAVAYARYVLCPNRTDSDPCEECPTCYRTARMEHPDLHFVYPVNKSKKAITTGRQDEKPISDQFIHLWREFLEQNNGVFTEKEWYSYIDIENQQGLIAKQEANEILRKMSFKSFEGGYKIVIIYLPERMNDASANTLLKLIEEPPLSTLFLFVSETPDRIITTIRSRVQEIILAPVTELGIDDRRSEEYFELFSSLMRSAYGGRYVELLRWAESVGDLGRERHKAFVEYSVSLLRDCYVIGVGAEGLVSIGKEEVLSFAKNFAPFVNELTIELLVSEFELIGRQIRANGSPMIIFTHASLMISKILTNAKRSLVSG